MKYGKPLFHIGTEAFLFTMVQAALQRKAITFTLVTWKTKKGP